MSTGIIKFHLKHGQSEFSAEGSLDEINSLLDKVWMKTLGQKTESAISEPEQAQNGVTVQVVKKPDKSKSRQRPMPTNDSEKSFKLGASFYKDFEPIDLGLNDKEEVDAKNEYASYNLESNKDKVAVALHVLAKFKPTERHFSYDQIYMTLRVCGEKDQPANMSKTIGELITPNLVAKESNGIRLKVQGSDYVATLLKSASAKDGHK